MDKCPICKTTKVSFPNPNAYLGVLIDCTICGKFSISDLVIKKARAMRVGHLMNMSFC
jgi:hypothetical protein